MNKILCTLMVLLSCLFISGCIKKNATFEVSSAYYELANGDVQEFYNRGKIDVEDISSHMVHINVLFEYYSNAKNTSLLPLVVADMNSITYEVKVDSNTLLKSDITNELGSVVFENVGDNRYVIRNTTNIRIPITITGTYTVTCSANYYINNNYITKPFEFTFIVK